jgi:uncharacterized protein YecE (DUF72 family)
MTRGRLLVGTSGFAYPAWAPAFYPPGLRGDAFLAHYARRLPAVELNNTFYARPTAARIATWVAQTPPEFRFVVKAQRGGSMRALLATPDESVPWLTEHLDGFGSRLGAVLFRVPANVRRRDASSDAALRRLLAAWPAVIPLVVELQDASWHVDETFRALEGASASLCATELPEDIDPPTIRRTGGPIYLRLRRHAYTPRELLAWARRIEPFIEDGADVLAFFRHDDSGRAPTYAADLAAAVASGSALPPASD